jgi:hypothetical protein
MSPGAPTNMAQISIPAMQATRCAARCVDMCRFNHTREDVKDRGRVMASSMCWRSAEADADMHACKRRSVPQTYDEGAVVAHPRSHPKVAGRGRRLSNIPGFCPGIENKTTKHHHTFFHPSQSLNLQLINTPPIMFGAIVAGRLVYVYVHACVYFHEES